VLAGGLELLADQAQAEEEDPEVVLGRLCVKVPLAAGRRAGIEGLGGEGQAKLDVGLDLAGVEGGFEESEFDRAAVPYVMEV